MCKAAIHHNLTYPILYLRILLSSGSPLPPGGASTVEANFDFKYRPPSRPSNQAGPSQTGTCTGPSPAIIWCHPPSREVTAVIVLFSLLHLLGLDSFLTKDSVHPPRHCCHLPLTSSSNGKCHIHQHPSSNHVSFPAVPLCNSGP